MKRLLDLTVSISALLLALPVFGFVAAAIRMNMGSPVFFRHKRPGLNGRPFFLLKFRTMSTARDESGKLLAGDRRLTRLGRLLRGLSLDELPQLINVLRGDMSLVGPRPLLMEYLELYTPEQKRRQEVKPGITGWAQVNGRNALSWEDKFALDVWYVDHQCFLLDLKILWLTLVKVFTREGILTGEGKLPERFSGTRKDNLAEGAVRRKVSTLKKDGSGIKILLTSAGSGVGEAIFKSLAISRLNSTIVATDISSFNSGAFRSHRAYKIVGPEDPRYHAQIVDICRREDIDVILCGSDTELESLSELKATGLVKSFIMTGSPEAVRICRDKKRTYEFFQSRGLPYVKTVSRDGVEEIIQEFGFPLLAKPKGGSGSLGVEVLMNRKELGALEGKENYIYQEYLLSENWPVTKATISRDDVMKFHALVQKDEISIQVLLGRNKKILGTFMSRNVLKFGMPTKIFPFCCEEYEEFARRMALCLADIGMIGPVNLQCKITDRGPVFFEVNPRFTGITSVRAVLGFREVEAMLNHFVLNRADEDLAGLLCTDYDSACCRYLDEYTFSKTKLEDLENGGYIENREEK
jgi:lipopolysaccharide/colanic/teichoic acid biosynthesis glycosyltransferase/carbamoylphosphate synthase large subunit